MRISININDDEQLREQIKELVAGQLRGLVREEIEVAVRAEISRLLDTKRIQETAQVAISQSMHGLVSRFMEGTYFSGPDARLAKMIEEHVNKVFTGETFNKAVGLAANAKIAAMAKGHDYTGK